MKSSTLQECRLSGEFVRLALLCSTENTMTVKTVIESLSVRSYSLVILFFSMPFVLPIPMPGLSVVFGICIAILGLRSALKKKLWLPKWCLNLVLPCSIMVKIFTKAAKVMQKLEAVIKPRGSVVFTNSFFHVLSGIMTMICGLLLAAPLPPGTNFPPAIALVFLSVASLEKDGLFMVLGYAAFFLNLAFFFLVVKLGIAGVQALLMW